MTVTRALGHWAAESPPIAAPVARERARHAIEDTVACMVAGADDAATATVRATAAAWGGGPATIVGGPGAPAPVAALVNGTAAHALDFDDNFHPGTTHASAVLVPALLALAEETDAPGARLVEAYLVGLELHGVLGQGVNRVHYESGWHATATVGCIGTAGACARLLGLDAAATVHAIGASVSMASGVKAQFGSMGKPLQAGLAAQNAVLAARLAERGFVAGADPLDGRFGFRALYAGEAAPGWEAVLPKLGKALYVERYGLAPKRHPCCGSAHRTIDGLLQLKATHGFGPDDVAGIDAEVTATNVRNLMFPEPRNEMEARFSMNYCLAVALRQDRLGLGDFTPAAVRRPPLRALLALTRMTTRPGAGESADPDSRPPARTTVRLKDGRTVTATVQNPKGTIWDPFDDDDRRTKFLDCTRDRLAAADRDALASRLAGIEDLETVVPITRPLRSARASQAEGDRAA